MSLKFRLDNSSEIQADTLFETFRLTLELLMGIKKGKAIDDVSTQPQKTGNIEKIWRYQAAEHNWEKVIGRTLVEGGLVEKPIFKSLRRHGLVTEEPLVFEKIIRSSFANPNRKNYTEYSLNIRLKFALQDQLESSYFLYGLLKTPAIEKFNSSQIVLQDIEYLWETSRSGEEVNKDQYSQALKKSDWYGPYKFPPRNDSFLFVTFSEIPDNEYIVELYIDVKSPDVHYLGVYYRKKGADIAPYLNFNSKQN